MPLQAQVQKTNRQKHSNPFLMQFLCPLQRRSQTRLRRCVGVSGVDNKRQTAQHIAHYRKRTAAVKVGIRVRLPLDVETLASSLLPVVLVDSYAMHYKALSDIILSYCEA